MCHRYVDDAKQMCQECRQHISCHSDVPRMSATDVLTFRCAKNVGNIYLVIQMCQECRQHISCHSDVPIMSATYILSFRCAKNVSNRCFDIQMCQECQQQLIVSNIQMCQECQQQMYCHSDVPRMSATDVLSFRCAKNVSNCLGRCIDIQMCQ
jgi:hypothetical protein